MAQGKNKCNENFRSKKNIEYEIITYDNKDGKIDGISVAGKIGKDVSVVYKTLVPKEIVKKFMYL